MVLFREEDTRNGLPLVFRGINTRRVVRASMQQEHRTLWSTLQRGNKSIKVEPNRFRVVIRIWALLDADIFEDGVVIGCMAVRCLFFLVSHPRAEGGDDTYPTSGR